MHISEFHEVKEQRSEHAQLIADFKASGVRSMAKTYTDSTELRKDLEKLRYLKGDVYGRNGWLVISKRGMDLILTNIEVEA